MNDRRTEVAQRVEANVRLGALMRQPLPRTIEAAITWYWDLEQVAKATNPRGWEPVQAWLGTSDLFYLLAVLLGRRDMLKQWLLDRCREVQAEPDGHLDLWAREHYKLQRLDEPTPTPSGWKLHGDLEVGDEIFGADGKVVSVIALNSVVNDARAYEIEFDDGSKLEAGAEHLWSVERRTRKRVWGSWKVDGVGKRLYRETALMRTEEIAAHQHIENDRLAIPVSGPLELPTLELPIEPYLLGCWLGDGSSADGRITCGDPALFDRIIARGATVGHNQTPLRNAEFRRVFGLSGALRDAGLIGNKHIPAIYLRASLEQRLELLRGLMDTDGHCNERGTATFVNINEALVDGVTELCHSLGLKPNRMKFIGTFDGAPYPSYQVAFQAYAEMAPFSLERKVVRCKVGARSRPRRYIVACRPVESSPMRCIQVSARDGLYLTGRSMIPTHNSTIITFGLTIMEILRNPEITIGIFSHTSDNAKGFLRQIKQELETNENLYRLYPEILYQWPAKESPKWSEKDGITVRRKGNPKEATVEAWGLVDGQPTGKHFKLRVYDDVVTRESVMNAEAIKKTTSCWELSNNLGVSPDQGGIERYIGTRYALYDTYSAMLARKAVVERRHPATHNGRFDGRPVFFSEEVWQDKLRKQGRATVAAQLLQNPMADEGASFRTDWLQAYEVRPRTLNVYIMCDPSRGRSANSDNTAISVVGVGSGGAKYLLDGACHRMTLSQRWQHLRGMYRRWSAMRGVQHVEVGYERYGAQSDDEYFQEQMEIEHRRNPDDRLAFFPITELNWPREGGNSKQERVERLEPDFRNGRFYLPLFVSHEGSPASWRVDRDPASARFGDIEFLPGAMMTKSQMQAMDAGSGDLICKPIIVRDPQITAIRPGGGRYDVTKHFISEYSLFPFGNEKDMIDATSRVFDMEPIPPMNPNSRTSADPPVYSDGF